MVVHLSAALIPGITPLGEASAQLGLGVLAVLQCLPPSAAGAAAAQVFAAQPDSPRAPVGAGYAPSDDGTFMGRLSRRTRPADGR